MLKNIILILIIIILLILFSFLLINNLYLKPLEKELKLEFIQKDKKIVISFKYPLLKDYFLKNFKISPYLEGDFIFEQSLKSLFHILGYKKVQFHPKKLKETKLIK